MAAAQRRGCGSDTEGKSQGHEEITSDFLHAGLAFGNGLE